MYYNIIFYAYTVKIILLFIIIILKLITSYNQKIRLNRHIQLYKTKTIEANKKMEELGFKNHKLTLDLEKMEELGFKHHKLSLDLEYSEGKNLELLERLVSKSIFMNNILYKSLKIYRKWNSNGIKASLVS